MVNEQTNNGKDSGFSHLLTTSSTLPDTNTQVVAEKEDSSAIIESGDILDWSIASHVCTNSLEHALHRSSMLSKPPEPDKEADWVWTGDEVDTERPTLLNVSSTPRRRKEMDAGFDRFSRSMSCGLRASSEVGSVDDGVSSQASGTTTHNEHVVTETALSTTIDSLDELADEPHAVLCSDFSWLYKHKRIRDTLLSIGATQSVLYEIMMRNRYYDECDEREQRMIVDTCKVRRAVEQARSARFQSRPACRYVFSDSENDEAEQNAPPTCKRGRPRNKGRPKKRSRWDANAVQTDSAVGLNMDTGEPSKRIVSATVDTTANALADPAYETPNTTNTNTQLRLQSTRRAKDVAKRAISEMLNYGRPRTKLRLV